MSWVIENSQTRGNQYIVLLMIANRADEDGSSAWPSIRWLSMRCRLSERTVQRCVRKLELGGSLVVDRNTGRHNTNYYHVVMQPSLMKGCQPVTPRAKGCQIDRVTKRARKGDRAVSPDTSYTSLSQDHLNIKSSSRTPDDLKQQVLSKCQDPEGIISKALDVVIARAESSGVKINSAQYLEKSLENFFNSLQDREYISNIVKQ
jgi:Helix-turn-helix domain